MPQIDELVLHSRLPQWGPGRVLAIDGTKVTVYFRDIPGDDPEAALKILDTRHISLDRSPSQSDPFLDNLPPFQNCKFQRPLRKRVTLEQGLDRFRRHYPLSFEDPAYIGDFKSGERRYKLAAHELWMSSLGDGQLESLLASNAIDELRSRSLAVESKLNVLAVFEKAALREGLRDGSAAHCFFTSLQAVLSSQGPKQDTFESYLRSVDALPSEGKTSPAKWTVATVLPFIAQPDRFMSLKPTVTQDCAIGLMFDLQYSPEPNWRTYAKLMEMSTFLLENLRPYGARDFIDVQSFVWLVGAGFDL